MYLQKQESLTKWHNALVIASGDYRIEDFYDEFKNIIQSSDSDSVVYQGVNK